MGNNIDDHLLNLKFRTIGEFFIRIYSRPANGY